MRRSARVDDNHPQIVTGLRQYGCSVQSLAACGKGVPDLLVGYRGRNVLLEIKNGKQKPSKRRLTPDEQRFAEKWRGQVSTVECLNDALVAVGITI